MLASVAPILKANVDPSSITTIKKYKSNRRYHFSCMKQTYILLPPTRDELWSSASRILMCVWIIRGSFKMQILIQKIWVKETVFLATILVVPNSFKHTLSSKVPKKRHNFQSTDHDISNKVLIDQPNTFPFSHYLNPNMVFNTFIIILKIKETYILIFFPPFFLVSSQVPHIYMQIHQRVPPWTSFLSCSNVIYPWIIYMPTNWILHLQARRISKS